MPIADSDQLFQLVKSLDKSEKRAFKLFAHRLPSNEDGGYVMLFDLLEKSSAYNESKILRSLSPASKTQLANLKRHLYGQILKSLRIQHSQKYIDIHIHELIDSAKILYAKGLYLQSLKILDKAKSMAKRANQDFLIMQIYELEKLIESRHITRSRKVANKVESLIRESNKTNKVVNSSSELLNLNLKIHGIYIKMGFVKTDRDLFFVKSYFLSNQPTYKQYRISFFERIYLLQSFVWYNYTALQFPQCYHNAFKWVEHFHDKDYMIEKDPDLYMRGMHYLLVCLFYMRHYQRFLSFFQKFESFYKLHGSGFNTTSQLVYIIYGYNAKLNAHLLKGAYHEGLLLLPELEKQLSTFDKILDKHRRIMFDYKMAWLYFGLEEFEKAIDKLNAIHNLKKEHLRNDIECYTRLFILICQTELNNYELVNNLISGTQRFFKNRQEENDAVLLIFDYLRKRVNRRNEIEAENLSILYDKLFAYRKDKYMQRIFIYFNFTAWIKSKIDNCSIPEVIQAHYKHYRRR